jgi:nucleotidyltransferase/DNA polymerase involved in DNA repair
MIGCVLVPHFAAAVERQQEPSPRHPQAHLLPAGRVRYQRAFDVFLEVLANFTPYLEPGDLQSTAIGYLDLGHLERAEATEMARRIGRRVREKAHLAPAIGLANGKFPAYVAAVSLEPNKALWVAPGREAVFLAPFPVNLLPLDKEMTRRLRLLGVRTLGQLAALPANAVLTQFGRQGAWLRQLARGCDNRPVHPHRCEAMEHVSRQLESPVADRAILEAVVQTMAVELSGRLRPKGLMGRGLRLILHLEDGTTHQEGLVMRHPAGDSERLTRVIGELIGSVNVSQRVTGLEIMLADLVPARGQQLDLFVHQTGQERQLRQALKDLVARYGAGCFYRASLPNREAHLPERRFRLQEMEAP